MRIFGREPALWLAFAAAAIKMFAAFVIHLSINQQSALNAIIAAVVGVWIAAIVKDGINAAVLGFIQALVALALGFGLNLGAEEQAMIMSFAATAIGMFTRTQVFAPEQRKPLGLTGQTQ